MHNIVMDRRTGTFAWRWNTGMHTDDEYIQYLLRKGIMHINECSITISLNNHNLVLASDDEVVFTDTQFDDNYDIDDVNVTVMSCQDFKNNYTHIGGH